jgi:PhzF family phenazine biosynthesis protein
MEPTVVWTTVFADGPSGGNPCPVVLGGPERTTEQMQAMAAGFGVETAFVGPASNGADAHLRYFVPRHEMEMCVHATVAATIVLAELGELIVTPARIETALGELAVEWDVATSTAVVPQFPATFGPHITGAARGRVLEALRISDDVIADEVGPIRAVSSARAKLMVPMTDEAALDALAPDYEQLWAVCDELGVTGLYPFTTVARGADVAARQFPRRSGYLEDPATGVAAAGLAAYLSDLARSDPALSHPVGAKERAGWRQWQVAQGRVLGRPSRLIAGARRDGRVVHTRVSGPVRRLSAEEIAGFG